jgi:DNA-3-methyladenine glycosylase II
MSPVAAKRPATAVAKKVVARKSTPRKPAVQADPAVTLAVEQGAPAAAKETTVAAPTKTPAKKAAAALPAVKKTEPPLPVFTPDYWQVACEHLQAKDRVMKRLIPQFGDACLKTRGDAFTTLARSIIGQQISVKAAQAVWERFSALPRRMTAANVLKLKVDDMRAAGLSARKVEYIVDLALHFDSGTVHFKSWETMDDEDIIAELVAIRGIGRWTAEMFLIFHLMRPNVLPLDDAGLISGISSNYFSGESVSRSDAREVAAAWAPYCSVATWYIWRSLDPLPVEI